MVPVPVVPVPVVPVPVVPVPVVPVPVVPVPVVPVPVVPVPVVPVVELRLRCLALHKLSSRRPMNSTTKIVPVFIVRSVGLRITESCN